MRVSVKDTIIAAVLISCIGAVAKGYEQFFSECAEYLKAIPNHQGICPNHRVVIIFEAQNGSDSR